MKTDTDEKPLARVCIPASFYIAVPMTDDSTNEELIAAAMERVRDVLQGYAIEVDAFSNQESACVYINDNDPDQKPSVEDRYW